MARMLPDRFFLEAVKWNPMQKIVLDHRTGQVYPELTNEERARRGLPVPWSVALLARETRQPPIP